MLWSPPSRHELLRSASSRGGLNLEEVGGIDQKRAERQAAKAKRATQTQTQPQRERDNYDDVQHSIILRASAALQPPVLPVRAASSARRLRLPGPLCFRALVRGQGATESSSQSQPTTLGRLLKPNAPLPLPPPVDWTQVSPSALTSIFSSSPFPFIITSSSLLL